MLYTFLVILFILNCALLVVTILMQSSKGGGLASSFGGMGGASVFGPRHAASFLQKATVVLGISFILLSILINLAGTHRRAETSKIQQEIQQMESNVPVLPEALPGTEAQPEQKQNAPQQNRNSGEQTP